MKTWYYVMSRHTGLVGSLAHSAWWWAQGRQVGIPVVLICKQQPGPDLLYSKSTGCIIFNIYHHVIFGRSWRDTTRAALSSQHQSQFLHWPTLTGQHRSNSGPTKEDSYSWVPIWRQLRLPLQGHISAEFTLVCQSYYLWWKFTTDFGLSTLHYTFMNHSIPSWHFLCFGNVTADVHPLLKTLCCTKSNSVVAPKGQDSKSQFEMCSPWHYLFDSWGHKP